MRRNESDIDRFVRLGLALVLVAIASSLGFSSVGGAVALVLAVVMGFTAATGFCALYRIVGFSTCRNDGAPSR